MDISVENGTATCEDMRKLMQLFIERCDDEARKFWDLITCLRGPDTPSERQDQSQLEQAQNYQARRVRKAKTVEIIRNEAFFGAVGGAARRRKDIKFVTVPPRYRQDHFDRHVVRAAEVLGLEVKTEE